MRREDLGLVHERGSWDDPLLPAKVERFRPDLLLVVHGRRFAAEVARPLQVGQYRGVAG